MSAIRIGAAALALALSHALAAVAGVAADDFGARVTLTTDYVFRGVSQSRQEPAVQGGFDYEHAGGFFAGIWATSVDFPTNEFRDDPRNLELDLYLGIERELRRNWRGSVTLIRYDYPSSDGGFDYAYEEALIGLRFREQVAAVIAYTHSAFGFHESSFTYELSAAYPIPLRLTLKGGAGYSDLQDLFGDVYLFWNVGISRALSRFTLDLSYFGTDSAGRRIWGELADDRVVLSVTATTR